MKNIPTTARLEITGLADTQAQLEMREADAWRVAAAGDAAALQQAALRAGREYRLTIFGGGTYKTGGAFTAEAGKIARLEVERREEERPCQETFPQRGLTIQRCPESQEDQIQQAQLTVWQFTAGQYPRQNRWLDIGLEISDMADSPELRDLRSLLLQSGPVDLIYRIQPTGADSGTETGQQIDPLTILAPELDAWTAQSRLIWWQALARSESVVKQEIFTEFAENRNIGKSGADLSWVAEILKTLAPGEAILTPIQAPIEDCWAQPVAGRVCQEETTGMEFAWIEGGTFWMGCGEQETECDDREKPRRQVRLAGFWMGRTEVTNAQYRQFKPEHDSQSYEGRSFNGDTQPAVYVSWEDAQDFAAWLTKQNGGKYEFRLPTEAEWEYAARAGTTTARYWGDDPNDACQFANVADDTVKETFKELTKNWSFHDCDDTFAETSPVASFKPNAFGLFDMLGNAWEWVADLWHDNYDGAPVDGSAWATGGGSRRVLRGGSWYSAPRSVRSAHRGAVAPSGRDNNVGFRLVRTN